MDWKLCQVFGERVSGEEIVDGDVVSAVQFDKTGNHLAVGDRGGRVVIFERKDAKERAYSSRSELEKLDFSVSDLPEFHYKTEFQSHEPEFDFLKSSEIDERINKIRWCGAMRSSIFVLTSNDKTIKLWKVKELKAKKSKGVEIDSKLLSESELLSERGLNTYDSKPQDRNGVGSDQETGFNDTKPIYSERTWDASCRKLYANAHEFNINALSTNSDGETFISADDLRINLWNLEISNQCFNIIDMKPSNLEDLTEVITTAEFHPIHCNLLAYSSSRGFVHLVDMRMSALCDRGAITLQDAEQSGPRSFLTEIIASISDFKFTRDGQHILTRDYMNLKVWDTRMQSSPCEVFQVHENLRPNLSDLYNTDSIFDKFECGISGDSNHFITGSYGNLLRIFCRGGSTQEGVVIEAGKNPSRPISQSFPRRRSTIGSMTRGLYRRGAQDGSSGYGVDNLKSKIVHLSCHPHVNLIASASANTLYIYSA